MKSIILAGRVGGNPKQMVDEDREELRRQPFNERLVEMARGKRHDIFRILYGDDTPKLCLQPMCIQFTPKQKPKVSYGIAFHNLGTNAWFVMEPRTTIEMRSIIRGLYTPASLPIILDQLYDEELEFLAQVTYETDFDEVFKKYYGGSWKDSHHIKLARVCWIKNWREIREMATKLIAFRKRVACELPSQRGFPKGRPVDDELPFATAIREVGEETDIKILFENTQTINQLGRSLKPLGARHTEIGRSQLHWVDCLIDFPNGIEEYVQAYICREPVCHVHSDITGRVYKTVLWICAFNLPDDPIVEISPHNYETRAGLWLEEDELFSTSRVWELAHKCETYLSRNYPYLTA